jgi:hypothetical protein
MTQDTVDITPAPRILVALAGNPLQPIDAICELMDNAFDSFRAGARQGVPQSSPFVQVVVPRPSEVRNHEGVVRVVDNGPGLDREGLTNALKAGFGGQDRTGDLGLFGVGFNIATAKIGRRTVVTTARLSDDYALQIELDLQELMRAGTFDVPITRLPKPAELPQGTKIEISNWWSEGSPNAGFALRLAEISNPRLRETLAHRYATLLRGSDKLNVKVNGELLKPLPACVWDESRYVERADWGVIPAQIKFDEVVDRSSRCVVDQSLVPPGQDTCPACGGTDLRQREERIRGWIGVQRYDDKDQFGIDLIRNGRAIRLGEKDAFFKFTDELGVSTLEYPIDQITGRIIGEVHLDHVPVDFLKQNFEQTSDEWRRAMLFLRGGSLLTRNWEDGESNRSPVSRIFHGYRKVRKIGKQDMYMGTYDRTKRAATRIDRSVEKDYLERFRAGEPGYLDDAKWWQLVEEATIPPVEQQEECATCGFQNIPDAQVCEGCSTILQGKTCISCGAHIIRDAVTCPECGVSQVPEISEPWTCAVCSTVNEVDDTICQGCQSLVGTPDPLSVDILRTKGEELSDLSLDDFSVQMSDGLRSPAVKIRVYSVSELRSPAMEADLPILIHKPQLGVIDVFVARNHPAYVELGVRPIDLLSMELASYFLTIQAPRKVTPHSALPVLATRILREAWATQITNSEVSLQESARTLFKRIAESLPASEIAADFYQELSSSDQTELAAELTKAGMLARLTEMIQDGSYMRYASPTILLRYFRYSPDQWFGSVFSDQIPNAESVGEPVAVQVRNTLIDQHSRVLEDAADATSSVTGDPRMMERTKLSLQILEESLQ